MPPAPGETIGDEKRYCNRMTTARRFPYVQVDVFTARPLEGNQLAVFTDARGLSTAEMQALARETRLSETTFVLPRPGAPADASIPVRIFTVAEELPFAGHPTLGTAWVLRGQSGAATVQLELGVGTIPVTFQERPEGAFGEMRQRDPEFGRTHERTAIAQAVGLEVDDIADDVPIQTVSTGLPFTIVPLRRLARLEALEFDFERASRDMGEGEKFFYFVCRETHDADVRLRARMIFYNGEDPATGSAAGCCAAWAVRYGVIAAGERAVIEQGRECLLPSRIYISADKRDDRIVNVGVGGHTVLVMRGEAILRAGATMR